FQILMARLLAVLFALLAVALAAPRDRRQAFLAAPNVLAPAIVGAQQSPGGHVTGASASIRIHASPAIQTPVAAPVVPLIPTASRIL
ncbi:hypothetical protein PRIPAC_78991, partial [Pristionchus pacificus]